MSLGPVLTSSCLVFAPWASFLGPMRLTATFIGRAEGFFTPVLITGTAGTKTIGDAVAFLVLGLLMFHGAKCRLIFNGVKD
jgi:hypothetical protein